MTALSVSQVAERWLTAEQAADYVGLSKYKFMAMVERNRLPQGYRASPRRVVWSAPDLDAAMAWFSPPRAAGLTPSSRQCVYFIGATKLIKIGTSAHAHIRMAGLQQSSPDRLRILAQIPGAGYEQEKQLHKYFASFRRHGEWFDLPKSWRDEVGLGGILVEGDSHVA